MGTLVEYNFVVPILLLEAQGVKPMNLAFSYLYSCGFWLQDWKGKRVGDCMFTFLGTYQRLAWLALRRKKNRFQMIPKLHYFAHIALEKRRQAATAKWVQNCLSTSVQCQEDFVGRPSRVSRRVDSRRLHNNVICRCLILANRALIQADNDERGMNAYGG